MKILATKVMVLMCAVFLIAATSLAEESSDSLDSRITFVNKLINESSAARRVRASDNEEAKRLQEEAATYYQAAISARASGELQSASDRLADAIRSMYAAVEAAGSVQQRNSRDNREYEERVMSVDALMSAHKQITEEKDLPSVHRELQSVVEEDMAAAENFHNNGNAEQASTHVYAAYEKVILAIEKLRQGETLVRQLIFETEEAEYLYELDRNDTHEMLFNLLVESGPTQPGSTEKSKDHVAAALDLRRRAEDLAKDGNYEEAIGLLEQSTSELVKAMRGAGVYIPG